jgi:hypothetical protein
MNRNSPKIVVHDSCCGAVPSVFQINGTIGRARIKSRRSAVASKASRRLLVVLFSFIASTVLAQTNFSAWCLIDTPPITGSNGVADTLANGLTVGEVDDPGYFLNGLYRSELIIELPPAPPNTILSSASLALYLEQNTGTTDGNPTFGPLQLYHRSEDRFFVSDSDYADDTFSYVAELLNPASPAGRYYSVDVTREIAADYGRGLTATYAKFRFQVDGLQFSGSTSHMYQFYFASSSPIYPAILDLKFEPVTAPLLSFSWKTAPSTISLQWPTNFGDFVLESTDSLTNSVWQSVTNAPVTVDDHFVVDFEANVEQQFFRLRQNP